MQNLQSELNQRQTNQSPAENFLEILLMELKLRRQIIGKLIKRLDEEKKMSNNGMKKRSNCGSDTTPTFRRIQDLLH